jgi:hypothetical protein
MTDKYILAGKTPIKCGDILAWGKWRDANNNQVARTVKGEVVVSTVFLGVDYAWEGTPLLFETMIFGGEHDQDQWRHSTWEEAEEGHEAACLAVKHEEEECE